MCDNSGQESIKNTPKTKQFVFDAIQKSKNEGRERVTEMGTCSEHEVKKVLVTVLSKSWAAASGG